MYNSLEDINNYLATYFGDDLVSLVIFGSYSKNKKFIITSDIDYFIVLKKMPKSQSSISREIKKLLQPQFPLIAFNIYSKKQFERIIESNYWVTLSLMEGNDIVIDKNEYFKKSINYSFEKIKNKKVGKLAWYIEKFDCPESILEHYRQVSKDFLDSSQTIFQTGQVHIALELLLRSVHTFMIGKLMTRNFYITSGEITQLFFDVYNNAKFKKYRNTFLRLEQSVGQYYSFGFDKSGLMAFGGPNSINNKKLYLSCIRDISLIKKHI